MSKVPTHLLADMVTLRAYEVHAFYDRTAVERDLRPATDINQALSVISQQFGYYADQHAKAEAQLAVFAELVDIANAALDKKYRKELAKTGEKVTERQVANSVTLDPIMREVNRIARDAREQVSLCKGACDAFRQRKDALIALAYNMREVMKGDPTVRNAPGPGLSRQLLSDLSPRELD